ncbi:hypothetical protein L3Q82_002592 [Scortum barcoo]|uniref:Uncharacterized protein n=1 Tax=Scortum barcoo TaxID=214431 RepID=A0ACB8VW42_9TELE|nr:hypothetical protein L3Q82_002592 [Scortum barcoo]
MILNHRDEELSLRFMVKVDDYDHVIFATSSVMTCFGCGEEGHTVRACPVRAEPVPPGPGGGGWRCGGFARRSAAWCGAGAVLLRRPGACHAAGLPARGVRCVRGRSRRRAARCGVSCGCCVCAGTPGCWARSRSYTEARLDISSSVTPGLTAALCRSRTLSLQQLVDAVGPALGDAEALSSLLSLHSVRVAGRILSLWRQKLSGKERSLLIDSSQGKIAPNPADSFPDVCLSPELGDLTGPLLAVVNPDKMTSLSLSSSSSSSRVNGGVSGAWSCEEFRRVPVVQVCFGPGSGATGSVWAVCPWWRLTRRHAVRLVPAVSCSVEEVSLAVGEVVGYGSVKSASRMNGAVLIFLDSPEKVSDVVVSGVVIQDSFTPVHPLVNPARKITISNVPPFIRNEVLAKELSRFGQLVSPIKMLSLGSKSPPAETRRVCHRRQVFMVLRENSAELNLSFNFKVDGFSYMVFATSETMKCFGCGAEGHLIRSCPEGAGGRRWLLPLQERGSWPRRPEGGRLLQDRPLASGDPSACSGGEVSVKSRDQLQRKDSVQADGEKQKDISDEVKQTECVNSEKPHDDLSLCEEQFVDDEDMSDDELLKLSQKRKNIEPVQKNVKASKMIKGSKAGKPPAESESESLLSQEEQTLYSPVDIKKFLQGTKGTRLLKVEDHFSDLKLFIESAKPLTKTSGDLTESLSLFLAVSNNGGTLERLRLSNFVNKFTRNVTRDMTRSMRDLEIQLVELQSRAESTGDRGLLNSLKSKKRALANLLGVAAEEDLLEVFNDCLERGRLPLSCRRAVITLLPKKGDLQELKNWRPVSLLCTDYKIMSKVLASRLREVMASIIHPDQTYCVPGRLISDNVTLIRDILEVSGSLAVDTGLISIDQEKAFDRVEHKYLWQTLAAFGFSPGFIAKIRVLYCDIASVLKINGGLSAPFRVQRGIRQGCCLSGMLYSLAIEPLLHKLRNKLSGVYVPGCDVSFKLSAYADDVVALVNSQKDIDILTNTVDQFGCISSARVNWGKSEAVVVGDRLGGQLRLPGGLMWKKGGLKYLGVFLGNEMFVKKNWENVLEKVKGRLEKWKWLVPKMSYRGRVLILNNLISTALWHRLACVDPPVSLLSRIQAVLVDFFWDRLHWVPQSILFLPKEEGGQGLVHLASRGAAFPSAYSSYRDSSPDLQTWFGGVYPAASCRVWILLRKQRREQADSLYWLLQEPVLFGGFLDCPSWSGPTLSRLLRAAGVSTLGQVVELAGPRLDDPVGLAAQLGLRSTRIMGQILKHWRQKLTAEQFLLLNDFCYGSLQQNCEDPFPPIRLFPDFKNCSGPLLELADSVGVSLEDASGKTLYRLVLSRQPPFPQVDFTSRVWGERLYWLFKESLTHQARLDLSSSVSPGLMVALYSGHGPTGSPTGLSVQAARFTPLLKMIKLFSLKQQKKDEESAGGNRTGAGGKKASAAQLRIQKANSSSQSVCWTSSAQQHSTRHEADINELNLPKTCEINFPDDDDLLNFRLIISPPDEGFYKGGKFVFSFKVGQGYPHDPPKVKCETMVYHPNIDLEGNVCLNILREDWTAQPVLTINSIIYGLQYLFLGETKEMLRCHGDF